MVAGRALSDAEKRQAFLDKTLNLDDLGAGELELIDFDIGTAYGILSGKLERNELTREQQKDEAFGYFGCSPDKIVRKYQVAHRSYQRRMNSEIQVKLLCGE